MFVCWNIQFAAKETSLNSKWASTRIRSQTRNTTTKGIFLNTRIIPLKRSITFPQRFLNEISLVISTHVLRNFWSGPGIPKFQNQLIVVAIHPGQVLQAGLKYGSALIEFDPRQPKMKIFSSDLAKIPAVPSQNSNTNCCKTVTKTSSLSRESARRHYKNLHKENYRENIP